MAKFDTKSIRNIALLGHGGSGKTSLAESMLYIAGATDRLGKISDGNTVCDCDPEEIKRGFTLSASVANMEWKGIKINLLDTPGYLDFVGEVNQALRVAGSAVITVDAKAGVEVGTELAWDNATAFGVPKVFFVNKCDDPEANFERVFNELHFKFGRTVCPVFVPVGNGKDITMLDLIGMKAYKYDYRGKRTEGPVLEEYKEVVGKYREVLGEALAGTSDELMMKDFLCCVLGEITGVQAQRRDIYTDASASITSPGSRRQGIRGMIFCLCSPALWRNSLKRATMSTAPPTSGSTIILPTATG